MTSKVWLITGTSKGFGKVWAEAAMQRGDKVIATSRNIDSLSGLVREYGDSVFPVALDVNNRQACLESVEKAVSKFGQIDVLVNNAGYGHFGFAEEISEVEARRQIETNVFGSIWMIQAILPIMRSQQRGHIVQVSSIGRLMTFPGLSIYHASKWAMEGFCEALQMEVNQFGIKTTLIEPTAYATEWATTSASYSHPMEAYNGLRDALKDNRGSMVFSDPKTTSDDILKIVDAENPPLRFILGRLPYLMLDPTFKRQLETWNESRRDVSDNAR